MKTWHKACQLKGPIRSKPQKWDYARCAQATAKRSVLLYTQGLKDRMLEHIVGKRQGPDHEQPKGKTRSLNLILRVMYSHSAVY